MTNLDRKSIGEEIRNARKAKKISQFELAELTGIDEKQIYRIETGITSPKLENFLKIAGTLDLNISYFTGIDVSDLPYSRKIIDLLTDMPQDKAKICYAVIKTLSENL